MLDLPVAHPVSQKASISVYSLDGVAEVVVLFDRFFPVRVVTPRPDLKRQDVLAADLESVGAGQEVTKRGSRLHERLIGDKVGVVDLARPGRPFLNAPRKLILCVSERGERIIRGKRCCDLWNRVTVELKVLMHPLGVFYIDWPTKPVAFTNWKRNSSHTAYMLKIGGLPFFKLGRLLRGGQEENFSNC